MPPSIRVTLDAALMDYATPAAMTSVSSPTGNGDLHATVDLGGAFDFGTPIIGVAGPAAVLLRVAP